MTQSEFLHKEKRKLLRKITDADVAGEQLRFKKEKKEMRDRADGLRSELADILLKIEGLKI